MGKLEGKKFWLCGEMVQDYACDICGSKASECGNICRDKKSDICLCSGCILDFYKQLMGLYESEQKRFQIKSKVSIPTKLRWDIWKRDNFTCQHCGSRKYLTIDHIIPECKGGKTTLSNLQTLCKKCNSKKGIKDK